MPHKGRTSQSEYLERAIAALDQVREHINGLDREAFMASTLHQDAVLMQLMQVGENLKPLDDPDGDLRVSVPAVGEIIGMRNYIAHEYRRVDMDLVWVAVTEFVPPLRESLQGLLDAAGPA